MKLNAEITMTPQQVAAAFWDLNSKQQCEFFEELHDLVEASWLEARQEGYVTTDQFLAVRDEANKLPVDRRRKVIEMIQRIAVWHMPLWATANEGEFFGGTPAETRE